MIRHSEQARFEIIKMFKLPSLLDPGLGALNQQSAMLITVISSWAILFCQKEAIQLEKWVYCGCFCVIALAVVYKALAIGPLLLNQSQLAIY